MPRPLRLVVAAALVGGGALSFMAPKLGRGVQRLGRGLRPLRRLSTGRRRELASADKQGVPKEHEVNRVMAGDAPGSVGAFGGVDAPDAALGDRE